MNDIAFILVYVSIGLLAAYFIIFYLFGLRVISSSEVAVIEKWWSLKGSLKDDIIALKGESGYSPDLLLTII